MARTFACLALSLTLLTAARHAAAADGAATAADAQMLGRLMNEQTIGLLCLDTERVSEQALSFVILPAMALFNNAIVETAGESGELVAAARALKQAGADRVYLLLQAPAVFQSPALICAVPTSDAEAADRIEKQLKLTFANAAADGLRLSRKGSWVVADATRRAEGAEAPVAERPGLAAALETIAPAASAAIWAPTADQRRVLAELLPLSIAGSDALAPGLASLQWGAAAFDDGEKGAFRAVFQHDSDSAAESAAVALAPWIGQLAARLPTDAPLGEFGPFLKLLKPKASGSQVVIELTNAQLAAAREAVKPALEKLGVATSRQQAMQRLKHVGLAMHNFAASAKDAQGKPESRLPDTAIRDDQGRPLLSWRVHLLPHMGEDKLYKEFRLNEPWDSDHNRQLIRRMPTAYKLGTQQAVAAGRTCVVVPVGDATLFPKGQGVTFKKITDGLSNTLLAVAADDEHAVIWTQPGDLEFDPERPLSGLGKQYGDGFLALMADGSVQFIESGRAESKVRALFTRAANDIPY